jgi:hypothetical protein
MEVVRQGVGGCDDVVTGLEFDGAVAAGCLHEFAIGQPARSPYL